MGDFLRGNALFQVKLGVFEAKMRDYHLNARQGGAGQGGARRGEAGRGGMMRGYAGQG